MHYCVKHLHTYGLLSKRSTVGLVYNLYISDLNQLQYQVHVLSFISYLCSTSSLLPAMQEALLVQQALNGGATGPGSGLGESPGSTRPPGPPPLGPPPPGPFGRRFPFRGRGAFGRRRFGFGPGRFRPRMGPFSGGMRGRPGGPGGMGGPQMGGGFPEAQFPGMGSQGTTGLTALTTTFPGETLSQAPQQSFDSNIGVSPPATPAALDAYVSDIQEDAYGFYYVFSAGSQGVGIRVNITKDGFCSQVHTNDPSNCLHTCYSDEQCAGVMKCCPTRCALECVEPLVDQTAASVPVAQQALSTTIMSQRVQEPTPLGCRFMFTAVLQYLKFYTYIRLDVIGIV